MVKLPVLLSCIVSRFLSFPKETSSYTSFFLSFPKETSSYTSFLSFISKGNIFLYPLSLFHSQRKRLPIPPFFLSFSKETSSYTSVPPGCPHSQKRIRWLCFPLVSNISGQFDQYLIKSVSPLFSPIKGLRERKKGDCLSLYHSIPEGREVGRSPLAWKRSGFYCCFWLG